MRMQYRYAPLETREPRLPLSLTPSRVPVAYSAGSYAYQSPQKPRQMSMAPQQQSFNAMPGTYTPHQIDVIIKLQRWWRAKRSKKNKLHETLKLALYLARGDGDGIKDDEHNLDFKYWIEAADPHHRYGSQLAPYYQEWLKSGTHQPFFKWLDAGAGKNLDLSSSPRAKLMKSSVTYFTESQRREYEVDFVNDGDGDVLLAWKRDSSDGDHVAGDLIDTPKHKCFLCCYRTGLPTKYIFVVDRRNRLFTHPKKSGFFHHSSFLSGGVAHAAGGMVIEDGRLLVVNGSSGHYKPTVKMLETAFGYFEDEYGLDPESYIMVYPRTRKICGPCTPGCLCFKKLPMIPANFPC